MIDCWHTQLRLVHQYYPTTQLRPMKDTRLARGGIFVYVLPTVDRRETRCPLEMVARFRELGYTVIRIEEPR